MCVALKMKIKSVRDNAPKVGHVACGQCEECRQVYQNAWVFRLSAELKAMQEAGYKVGFLTLTYSNENVPHFTSSAFEGEPAVYPSIPCFNRDDCEGWIHALRQWLYRQYGCEGSTALKYMLCSEFGAYENTHRPHYHVLLMFPGFIDTRAFFKFAHEKWLFGYVFPRYYEGGLDSHGYNHKPFIVESGPSAARYCAKYCVKDLYYNEFCDDSLKAFHEELERKPYDKLTLDEKGLLRQGVLKFNRRSPAFRRRSCFHMQSRGLGSSLLCDMDDSAKMELLKKGISFVGDTTPRMLPVYLRNKIIYDNKYVYEVSKFKKEHDREAWSLDGKKAGWFHRLVRREANDFFHRHSKEIFDLKVKVYRKFFDNFKDTDALEERVVSAPLSFWNPRIMPQYAEVSVITDELRKKTRDEYLKWIPSAVRLFNRFCDFYNVSTEDVAMHYLVNYGVKEPLCFAREDMHLGYLSHYCSLDCFDFSVRDERYDEFIRDMSEVLDNCFDVWNLVSIGKTDEQRRIDRIRSLFNHME